MAHTSTGQPEALRLARWLEHRSMSGVKPNDLAASTELRRLYARVQDLEASRRAPAVPLQQEVIDALDRMDALLKPGLGLLAVGDESATAQASRRDMAAIRAALAAAPQPPEAAPVQLPEPVGVAHSGQLDSVKDGYAYVYPVGSVGADCKLYTEHQVRQLLAQHGIK